ncbi:E4 SUMO-protein ligase PIAL2-like isoform X3 [Humulus lupulus]|uniref:E4 SUMO-protein ligase PIAL2-like isoform X3 n=1 Tax=Humulus lupulus TaxID=3486 RepID=UPI002B40C47D|nr:E4 SUMO-protein ligase PIAL2-like isoform X3 [Humulus lupulus]
MGTRMGCPSSSRLATILKPGQHVDSGELFFLCLSLARGIDFAVANSEKTTRSHDLSTLVKQICEQKSYISLQAMIMVVMISVKNACKVGWFSEKETKELYSLANEIGMNFCSPGDINTAPSCLDSTVATVMTRFYPQLKIGHILVSLDVKPGNGIYAIDFQMLKNNAQSQEEKIGACVWLFLGPRFGLDNPASTLLDFDPRALETLQTCANMPVPRGLCVLHLFVAQVDNVETSACIITPQQVNFIVNGRGIKKRTNMYMDAGPQMPTNVTPLMKYGTNLLQAVGQFNGTPSYNCQASFKEIEVFSRLTSPPQ